jgi:hypothetical protein
VQTISNPKAPSLIKGRKIVDIENVLARITICLKTDPM